MKFLLNICIFSLLALTAKAQQFALYNTRTLFDTFENPAQPSFTLDSSRQFLSNFLIPYLDISSIGRGDTDTEIRSLLNSGYQQSRMGPLLKPKITQEDVSVYLFTAKLFRYHRFHAEMGFAWQVRVNSSVLYDEGISKPLFIGNAGNFATIPRSNIFNNQGKLQAYHQLSFTYRENYNKNWAFGLKASLLSGISYADFYAIKSIVNMDPVTDILHIQMTGNYRMNYPKDLKFSFKNSLPIRNLGAAISLGASYRSNSGVFLLANVKDLGFIRWGKRSVVSVFDDSLDFTPIVGYESEKRYLSAMDNIGRSDLINKRFTSTINSRIDFLASKTFGAYTPNIIVTKNIFDRYGEVALANNLQSGVFRFSVVPGWNFDGDFKLGAQGMILTPNFEMFLGTNDLIQTYYTGKSVLKDQQNISTGYGRASVYLGMAFKIGYIVEHPMNMSWMPGIGKQKDGFFKRIFNIFKRKDKDEIRNY